MPLKRFALIVFTVLILWPTAGWIFLHLQAGQLSRTASSTVESLISQHTNWQLNITDAQYRTGLVPVIEWYNTDLFIPAMDEPIQLAHVSLRGRWYSLWVFRWLPDRVEVHQARAMQQTSETTTADLTTAWAIAAALPNLQVPFVTLRALDVQQLDLTLYDDITATWVDVTLSAELKRSRGQEYQLQSIADLRGDGWVEHGFAELQMTWGLRPNDLPVRIITLDTQLEVHSSTRDYGIYRWEAQAEQLYINPHSTQFEARDLSISHARSQGRVPDQPLETGIRWALFQAQGTPGEQNWQASTVQRAQVERPQLDWVEDLQWIQQYDQWNSRGPGTVGRTEISWQARLNHPHLSQILVQLNQQQSSDITLNRWSASPANIAIDVRGHQRNHVLRGRADALSDLDQRTLHLTRMELSELSGNDTYWLYGHLLLDDQGLSFDDLIGPTRGTEANPYQPLRFWADCYDHSDLSATLSLMNCSAELRR